MPSMPTTEEDESFGAAETEQYQVPASAFGRSRATTSSTTNTVTPPRVDGDLDVDLGGDFSKLLLGANNKRGSVATMKEEQNSQHALAPRALTGSRMNQPSPLQIDSKAKVEAPPYSWSSNHSNDQLLKSASPPLPAPVTNENIPPPVPSHASSPSLESRVRPSTASGRTDFRQHSFGQQQSANEQEEGEDEKAMLLKELSMVSKYMNGKASGAGTASPSRYRRNEDNTHEEDDSLFDTSHTYSPRPTDRLPARKPSPQSHKVMTPAEFESYRKDKERQVKERRTDSFSYRAKADDDDDDNDNYEEDEDDLEKAKQQAKQRRKQEAHLSVYRQQMMKVTGESMNASSRSGLQTSYSAPNLPNTPSLNPGLSPEANTADNSDEDEEIPLAILAAHGFPSKTRAPARLSTMMSNPNLRAAQQPSYQRPSSAMGEPPQSGNPRLPAFARNLPQDPFLGAGLIRNSVRESFAFGGGSSAPMQGGASVPPGGLIGVIANEERSRAMRRGSPHIDGQSPVPGAIPFDSLTGIPSHMMYQNTATPSLTLSDQAHIQMTQQMQQFMQMQMQFMQMQMMANHNGNMPPQGGHMAAHSLGSLGAMNGMMGPIGTSSTLSVPGAQSSGGLETMRHSFAANDSMLDLPGVRGDTHLRTMSMVQPSSASWVQPPQNPGFTPSIRIQGGGYAPSIAPSERSNIGLPGRYRPVSHAPSPHPLGAGHLRKSSTMSGAIPPSISVNKSASASDDDDEEGWEAMKAKRDKKKNSWKTKKSIGNEIKAFIS